MATPEKNIVPDFQQPYASKRPPEFDDETTIYTLPRLSFRQAVSWSQEFNVPLSLGQFIISNVPELHSELGLKSELFDPRRFWYDKSDYHPPEKVRGIWDLTDHERWEIVRVRIYQGFTPKNPSPTREYLYYFIEEYFRGGASNSTLDMVIVAEQRIYLLEKAALQGRIRLKENG